MEHSGDICKFEDLQIIGTEAFGFFLSKIPKNAKTVIFEDCKWSIDSSDFTELDFPNFETLEILPNPFIDKHLVHICY